MTHCRQPNRIITPRRRRRRHAALTIAVIPRGSFSDNGTLDATDLEQRKWTGCKGQTWCTDALWRTEPTAAVGSAVAISPREIVTAAHVLRFNTTPDELFFVSGYTIGRRGKRDPRERRLTLAKATSVRIPRGPKRHRYSRDWAIVTLDRDIVPRGTIFASRVSHQSPLHMLGFPLGIPLKETHTGKICSRGRFPETPFWSFKTNLYGHEFSSGSPIFNKNGAFVGLYLGRETRSADRPGIHQHRDGRSCCDSPCPPVPNRCGFRGVRITKQAIESNDMYEFDPESWRTTRRFRERLDEVIDLRPLV